MKFRQAYEQRFVTQTDAAFFVGTVAKHPGSWMIGGLWYAPRGEEKPAGQQGELFAA